MHGHQDSDHYDVQFSTRQLVLLFGLLIVIVVGVFVGGIVIGRGMAPSGAEALVARGVSPAPAPALAEAPTGETLRLPIPTRFERAPTGGGSGSASGCSGSASGCSPPGRTDSRSPEPGRLHESRPTVEPDPRCASAARTPGFRTPGFRTPGFRTFARRPTDGPG